MQETTEAVMTNGAEQYLTEVELLKFRLFMAEQQRAEALNTLATIKKLSYLKQIDPNDQLAKFDQELAALNQQRADAQKQYQETLEAAQSRLGLNLQDYTFDGQTGLLRKAQ